MVLRQSDRCKVLLRHFGVEVESLMMMVDQDRALTILTVRAMLCIEVCLNQVGDPENCSAAYSPPVILDWIARKPDRNRSYWRCWVLLRSYCQRSEHRSPARCLSSCFQIHPCQVAARKTRHGVKHLQESRDRVKESVMSYMKSGTLT